jgi:hypothetical protein
VLRSLGRLFLGHTIHVKSISIAWVDVQLFLRSICGSRDAVRFSGGLTARDVRSYFSFVGTVIGGMCTAARSALRRAEARNAGGIEDGIGKARGCGSTIASRSGGGGARRLLGKKTWRIILTRRGSNLRGFPRRCAWPLLWRSSAAPAERKPGMMKLVVSFAVAGRDSSISQTDLRGKEIEVLFCDIQADKGGVQ